MSEWHPASEPAKPEDFEPTGYILVQSTPSRLGTGWVMLWNERDYNQFKNISYWMRIPNPPAYTEYELRHSDLRAL